MLYHKSLKNFPQCIREVPERTVNLVYTNHAINEAKADRYCRLLQGDIQLPKSITFSSKNIIEVEIIDGTLIKAVIRTAYNSTYDLCLVITSDNFVKTVWLNSKYDKHYTLDLSKYA